MVLLLQSRSQGPRLPLFTSSSSPPPFSICSLSRSGPLHPPQLLQLCLLSFRPSVCEHHVSSHLQHLSLLSLWTPPAETFLHRLSEGSLTFVADDAGPLVFSRSSSCHEQLRGPPSDRRGCVWESLPGRGQRGGWRQTLCGQTGQPQKGTCP